MNHTKLTNYLNGLPKNNPSLAPLLLYTNRNNIRTFLKKHNKITMLVPSTQMMSELRDDFEKKRFRDLDLKVMSLFMVGDVKDAENFKNNSTINNMSHQIGKEYLGRSKVKLHNGATASVLKSHDFCCWQLNGDHIPKTIKAKKGGFENPQGELTHEKKNSSSYTNAVDVIKKTINKDGFKRAVCELYACLPESEQEVVKPFINNSPMAEFFLMYDSPICHPDLEKLENTTVSDWENCYNDLCTARGEFLLNSGNLDDINELKTEIDSGEEELENKLKTLFSNSELGSFELNGKSYNICPEPMAKYLMSYAIFSHHLRSVESKFYNTPKDSAERDEILMEALVYNSNTNVENSELNYFKYASLDDIEDISKGVKLFHTFLAPMFKSDVKTGQKEIKLKNRKTHNMKKKISKLSQEQKKKLLQFLSKN